MWHSCCQESFTYQSAWMSLIPAQVTSLITKTLSQKEPHCTDEIGNRKQVNVIFAWRRKSAFTCSHVKRIKHHVHIFSRSSGCAPLSFTSSTGLQTERYNKQEAGEPQGQTNRKQHINRVPNYEDLLCCWWSLVEATVSNGVTGRMFQSRCFINAVGLSASLQERWSTFVYISLTSF